MFETTNGTKYVTTPFSQTAAVASPLAAILALSAGSQTATHGAVLLGVYALGLGLPFLLFGLAFTRSLAVVGAVRAHWRVVSAASGWRSRGVRPAACRRTAVRS